MVQVGGAAGGEVTSPGFPAVYPNSHRSVVTLAAPPGQTVQLQFSGIKHKHRWSCLVCRTSKAGRKFSRYAFVVDG